MARLAAATLTGAWSEASIAEALAAPGARLWLGGEPGRTAPEAFLLAKAVAGELHVLTLGVLSALRRRGLARALVEAALAGAGACHVAHLEVRASNAAALALYRSAGFVVVGQRPRYYRDGEDALLLTRTLKP